MWFLCLHVCFFCKLPVLNLFTWNYFDCYLLLVIIYSLTKWDKCIFHTVLYPVMTHYVLRWSFHCLRLNKLYFPVLIFVAMIKRPWSKTSWDGKSYFPYTSHHNMLLKDIMAGNQGEDPWRRSHGGTLTTSYVLMTYSA